jgi:uncharacterized membrane protein (DUF441 family)
MFQGKEVIVMLLLPREEEGRVFFQLAEKGQGLVEYGTYIAIFVGIIIALLAAMGIEVDPCVVYAMLGLPCP